MVAKSSQEESGKEAGEGVEIVRNEPYEPDDLINKHKMSKGQYTYVFEDNPCYSAMSKAMFILLAMYLLVVCLACLSARRLCIFGASCPSLSPCLFLTL